MIARSWISSANASGHNFPVQNLPYGAFQTAERAPRCGVAIGDFVLDLSLLEAAGLLDAGAPVFAEPTINAFMGLGPKSWAKIRQRLTELLTEGGDPALRDNDALRATALVAQDSVSMMLPIKVAGYTDFYAGRQHAFNVGSIFRGPDNALPPNWLHIPIGYNGRASTVVVSGTKIRRPLGQRKPANAEMPGFGPSARLDIELELGTIVGQPTSLGEPISVAEADALIFGFVLLNDWSARDIQAWEYQPLGPFQSKAFATTISPWVVSKAALEAFRATAPEREKPLLPYLSEPGPMLYDIELEVTMQPDGASRATSISRTNATTLYYSAAQQLAHHAVSGCKMEVGDLLGSGTISGPDTGQYGSLLELTWNGATPLQLSDGQSRSFIEDGDTLTLRGWAQGDGYRIGFGDCSGTILPAPALPEWAR